MNLYDLNHVEVSWRTAHIPKKSGGVRELTIPNDALKEQQREVLYYLYSQMWAGNIKVSSCAHGFLPGKDCKSAVLVHSRKARCMVCTDITGFFDNCSSDLARAILLDSGIAPCYVDAIIRDCAYEGHFPQGSPTSPMLTNILMFDADNMIAAYAKKHGFVYTRYADDMQFSLERVTSKTERMLRRTKEAGSHNPYVWFLHGVDKILKEATGLQLNHKKDHIYFNKSVAPQQVLGIVTRQDGFGYNATRKLRKRARAMACNLYYKVLVTQQGRIDYDDWHVWSVLKGLVEYSNSIRRLSDGKHSSFDPCVQQKYYQPLEAHFAAARNV